MGNRGVPRAFVLIGATLLSVLPYGGVLAQFSAPSAPTSAPSALPTASVTAIPSPTPLAIPTQPPIIVEPPNIGIAPGTTQVLRVQSVLGSLIFSIANPALIDAAINQDTRMITVTAKQVGSTTLTIRDSRGLTRDIPINVAYPAGVIADATTLRITGNPATAYFIAEQAVQATMRATTARPGARILVTPESLGITSPLTIDNVTDVTVPVIVAGVGYLTVQGTTHVHIENVALPPIRPKYLMVSDFPEILKENGLLFQADLSTTEEARFLYYHANPAGQPDRHVVLKLENPSSQPTNVQFISGTAGPDINEMQVGHLSTQRFLVHNANNEGTVLTIPPNTTLTLCDQALPTRSVVSSLLQLREIDGATLHLTLWAQNASDPTEAPGKPNALLTDTVRHARGVYPVPEFFFDYQYDTSGANLDIPIGQIPIPELKQGQALAGDYGILQSVTVRIVNPDTHNSAYVALYANPRGGRATGTFIIDDVLIQAHALPAFRHEKLREYTIPPGGFIRTTIVTMPEGGSSYPLHLIVAPDDGSTSPGAPNSLVY